MRYRHTGSLAVVIIMLAVATGCAPQRGVVRTTEDRWFKSIAHSVLTGRRPSAYTESLLKARSLEHRIDRLRLEATLLELQDEFKATPSRPLAFALSELCYLHAKRGLLQSERTFELYVASMVYAYAYLFDSSLGTDLPYFDPRFRMACDLYNRSLARVVSYTDREEMTWYEPFRVETIAGPIEFHLSSDDRASSLREFDSLRTAYEYEVRGLSNHHRAAGFGVPLVLLSHIPPADEASPEDRFLGYDTDYCAAATAVIRFDMPLADRIGQDRPMYAQGALYDPLETTTTTIAGHDVPLEIDLTTALAYSVEQVPEPRGLTGLLDAEAWNDERGLYFTQPYDPRKIPVVLTHGLMSSPYTWLALYNDLVSDPHIRQHYQFWYFQYPTGNPVIYSAKMLRDSLDLARETFDPDHDNAAFDRMVLVGHSMGGLLSRLMVQDSGDRFWAGLSSASIEDTGLPEDTQDLLHSVFYFHPRPFVSRVVFIATPHRGSKLAKLWLSEMTASMIDLPDELVAAGAATFSALNQRGTGVNIESDRRVSTSIDDLAPDSPDIQLIASTPIAPGVPYHSIIANDKAAGVPGGTDTIVTYSSAHLDGAESELIVKGTHTCTELPLVIREVRRILLLHATAGASR